MADLFAKPVLPGQKPLTAGDATLSITDPGPITSIAAFPGQQARLAGKLGGLPAPNRFLTDPLRIWTGPDQTFLLGVPAPDPAPLAALAAMTDQTCGWAAFQLQGPGAEAVLARLYPLDLRAATFPQGHAARAPLGHMQSILARLEPQGFLILVFRSMAQTAWAELCDAMQRLEARARAGS